MNLFDQLHMSGTIVFLLNTSMEVEATPNDVAYSAATGIPLGISLPDGRFICWHAIVSFREKDNT